MLRKPCLVVLLIASLAACTGAESIVTPTLPADTPVPPTPTIETVATPTESPVPAVTDDLVIAFYAERDGDAEIYLMNADGSTQVRLTNNAVDDVNPDWSPDGKSLVFASDRNDPNPVKCFPSCAYEIYTMDVDRAEQGLGDQRRLTDSPASDYHPTWSPDGADEYIRQIAFTSERDGNQEIYVMEADGSQPRRLTDDPAGDMRPSWSPDGTQIAFNTMRDGNWDIYVMNVDGAEPGSGDQRPLTTSAEWELFPTWSPDGAQIAFFACGPQCRPNRQDIYVMDVGSAGQGSGNVRQLTDTPSIVDESPAWSPDGRQIVFQSDRDGNFEIYVMNSDGSGQQRLTNDWGGDYWPVWRPVPSAGPAPSTGSLRGGPFALEKSPQTFDRKETYQVGLGDLDGDGDLDAAFANMAGHDSQVWLNDGTGQFVDSGQALTQQGHGVGVGDLDGDGDLDLFITCAHWMTSGGFNRKPSQVYLNDGQGVFQESGQDLGDTELSGNDVNLLDVDGDGDLDAHVVYFEIGGMPDKVYLNDGQGRFTDSGLALSEEVIAWGDLDGDGDVDVFGKAVGQGYRALLNDGTGHLARGWEMADGQAISGGIALGDLDRDGDLDALVANGFRSEGSQPTRLLWNDGSGRFADSGQELNPTKGADLAVGDLDGDGDLDVFVANMDLPDEVWLNDGTGQLLDSGLRLEGSPGSMSTRSSLGDLDGDGDLDVFGGSFGGRPEIWFNTTE